MMVGFFLTTFVMWVAVGANLALLVVSATHPPTHTHTHTHTHMCSGDI